MRISEARIYLKDHASYFLDKNDTSIDFISSGEKYYFTSDCGHVFYSLPLNVIKEDGIHCPICSGRQVQKGVNDIWTTHPHLADALVNEDDGYNYTINSNVKLKWICNECFHIMSLSPNKMKNRKQLYSFCL